MKDGERADPIPTPMDQRFQDFRTRALPTVVWVAAIVAASVMLWGRGTPYGHVAIAESRSFEISSPTPGRLAAMLVRLNDRVDAGDVVARLDDNQVLAMLATSEATIRKIHADLETTRAAHRQNMAQMANDRRRFEVNEDDRSLEVLGLRVELETARVELESRSLDDRRTRELLDAGLLSEAEHDAARLAHIEVRRRVEETGRMLARAEEGLRASEHRRIEFEEGEPGLAAEEPFLLPLQRQIEVEARRLDEIQRQREALVLRSPVDGQVTSVPCGEGQAVTSGEAVVVVTEPTVREIVAYIDESDASTVAPETPVRVSSRTRRGLTGESVVLRIGEAIQALPQRLWPSPRMPLYGRAVVVAPVPGMDLVPGEIVTVSFRSAH